MKIAISSAVAALASIACAQDAPKIDVKVNADLSSKYVWRGLNMVNDWVYQPSVTASAQGFTLGFWGNLELTDHNRPIYGKNPAGKFTRWDSWLQYTYDHSDSWNGWVGYIDNQFPNTGAQRFQEWYVGFGLKNEWNPKLQANFGTKKQMGTYMRLSASHTWDTMSEAVSHPVTAEAWLGYGDKKGNNFFYGKNGSGFADMGVAVSSSWYLGHNWTITPKVTYTNLLDRQLLTGFPRRQNLWFSVGFSSRY